MRKITLIGRAELDRRLRAALMQGRLPDPFLYADDGGADAWLALDGSEAFDVATTLTDLLRANAPAVAAATPANADLLGLGVGDGAKERILLEHLAERGARRFVAADVSSALVDRAIDAADGAVAETVGVVAFCEDLPLFRRRAGAPALATLLGNNVCNYEPDALLGVLADCLDAEDRLLVDCRLRGDDERWRGDVERAYGSEANARFNLGPLLRRGLARDAAEFRIELVEVDTPVGPATRTAKTVGILADAMLTFDDGPVPLAAGEIIEMGFTYKYARGDIPALLRRAGFTVEAAFFDDRRENLLALARPTTRRSDHAM